MRRDIRDEYDQVIWWHLARRIRQPRPAASY